MEDKKNDYTLKEEQIARFAKALGHPARVAILHFLAKREACYFSEGYRFPASEGVERCRLDTRRDRDSQGEVLYQPGKLGDRPAVVREFLCGLREKEGDVLR